MKTEEKDITKLVSLVADDELGRFAEALSLQLGQDPSRNDIKSAIKRNRSRNTVLRAIADVAQNAICMLGDIVRFLRDSDTRVRTTGCQILLSSGKEDLESVFGPQLTGFLLDFDAKAFSEKRAQQWTKLANQWRIQISGWASNLIKSGNPRVDRRLARRALSRIALNDKVILSTKTHVKVRPEIIGMLVLWKDVESLSAKLQPHSASDEGASYGTQLVHAVEQLRADLRRVVGKIQSNPRVRDKVLNRLSPQMRDWFRTEARQLLTDPKEWVGKQDAAELFGGNAFARGPKAQQDWESWRRFCEDILSLATRKDTGALEELLRVDLFRDRPQLFEVWIMVKLLRAYQSWGYKLTLLSLVGDEQPKWNLKYSRAKEPVATLETSASGTYSFYFQLFVDGDERASMPDLALSEDGLDGPFVWIADPKYAEKGGYRKANYFEVARRYNEQFDPERVWVCEYFRRADDFEQDVHDIEPGVQLLLGFGLADSGLAELLRSLRQLHDSEVTKRVLVLDCSGSFRTQLNSLLPVLEERTTCFERTYCFADKVILLPRVPTSVDELGNTLSQASLGGGTALGPVVQEIESTHAEMPIDELVLVTDGKFSEEDCVLLEQLKDSDFAVLLAGNEEELLRAFEWQI